MEQERIKFINKTGERHFTLAYKDIIHDTNLSGNDFKIYMYLKSYGGENRKAFTGLERMKDELNITIPTIRKSLNNLEQLGYLKIAKQHKKFGSLNIYYILDPHISNNVTDVLPEVTESYDDEEKENKKRSGNDHITQSLSLIQENYFNQITPIKLESLIPEIEKLGDNAFEIISVAVDYTTSNNKNLNYLTKVINNWADDNVTTVEQAQEKVNGKPKRANNDWIESALKELGNNE